MIQSVNKYHIYEVLSADGNFYYTIPSISVNTHGVIVSGKHSTTTSVRITMNISSDLLSAFHWGMQSIHI